MNEQQQFWKDQYAGAYIEKNSEFNTELGIKGWRQMLQKAGPVDSFLECGSNIGRNIGFLSAIYPEAKKNLIEISPAAYDIVTKRYNPELSFNGPIVESNFPKNNFDLVYTMGVLIHIHPDDLLANMQKMFDYSSEYILMGEYFNRTPVMIEYQGEANKLFKRDFGKLFVENFPVSVVDHGFLWGHAYEDVFDDITYWLFKKNG